MKRTPSCYIVLFCHERKGWYTHHSSLSYGWVLYALRWWSVLQIWCNSLHICQAWLGYSNKHLCRGRWRGVGRCGGEGELLKLVATSQLLWGAFGSHRLDGLFRLMGRIFHLDAWFRLCFAGCANFDLVLTLDRYGEMEITGWVFLVQLQRRSPDGGWRQG